VWLPDVWVTIGRVAEHLVASGRPEAAARLALMYRRLRPGDPNAWMVLGHVLRQAGRISEVRAGLREALHVHPGNELLREHLIYAFVSPPHYLVEEARAEVDLLLESATKPSAGAEVAAATVAAHDRAWDVARHHAHRAERLLDASTHPFRAQRLGVTLMLIPGEDDAARRVWQRAATHTRAPYLPRIFYALLLETTDPSASRAELERARRGYRGSRARFDEEVRQARSALAEAIAWRDQPDDEDENPRLSVASQDPPSQ